MVAEEVKDEVDNPMAEFKKLMIRIYLLDDEARTGLCILLQTMVTMLEKKDGCSVTFADPLGDGFLSVLALGDQSLVSPILNAAAQFRDHMHKSPTEFLQ